jgi:hypothetical protein
MLKKRQELETESEPDLAKLTKLMHESIENVTTFLEKATDEYLIHNREMTIINEKMDKISRDIDMKLPSTSGAQFSAPLWLH